MDTAVIKSSEGYDVLLSSISNLWSEAKERAIVAVNAELIDTNWKTGQYIVEFEQGGNCILRSQNVRRCLTN